jgi:glycosyltransferase involved in cell wall biosynthesis
VSEETAEIARRAREVSPRKLRVIRNGVDLSRYGRDPEARRAVRAELGIPKEAWVVGAVGRLEPVKNHARLIRAAAPLLGDKTHLVIVGDGSLRDALQERAAALPSPARRAVHLVGLRRDVPRLLCALDAFAISSDSEGLPLGLLEAAASSLPILATAVGGIASTLSDGETGLLVPLSAGDEPATEARMRAGLEQLRDDEVLADDLAGRARALVEREHSVTRTADDYLQLYQTCGRETLR